MKSAPPDRLRRRLLSASGALLVAPALVRAQPAPDDLDALVAQLTGAQNVRDGRVTIDIPRIADTGTAVPLKVSVESPMSAQDHVRTIHVVAEKNPRPLVAKYYLGPRSGKAEVATRIRLNGTQRVVVIATLSDGSCWRQIAECDVTESACYDATNP